MHQGLFKNIALHKVYWHFIIHCICVFAFVYLHVRHLLYTRADMWCCSLLQIWIRTLPRGCIGLYIPNDRGSRYFLRDILRAERNLEAGGDVQLHSVQPNTCLNEILQSQKINWLEVVHYHSLIINPSLDVSENTSANTFWKGNTSHDEGM